MDLEDVLRLVWGILKGYFRLMQLIFRGIMYLFGFIQRSVPQEFSLPEQSRFEHTHIVGGSGHGKTQLIQRMLLDDIDSLREGKGSIVVIDSQGDMIRTISHMAAMKALANQVILIDPNDIEYPPCLNLFDFGLDRVNQYSALDREKLINGAIALYEYVFGALLGAELTNRQGVIFRYLARLMMTVPNATINTLIDFMQEPETTRPYLTGLDPVARKFFETQFFSNDYDDTRQQILTRLWGVLSNPVLAKMFTHERNKLNLFDAMNRGSIILINTAKDLLKQQGTEILGRFFIALICQAAQERASIPEEKRKHTFVCIDEAHDYFDESMENLLNQARKYKVGLILSHQNLDQFDRKLRSTVMASTSIKFVGGLSAGDAAAFAQEMRCEPEFLLGMQKTQRGAQFAVFIRNHFQQPMPLTIPFGEMEKYPRITDDDYEILRDLNRKRYCDTTPAQLPPPSTSGEQTGFRLGKQEVL